MGIPIEIRLESADNVFVAGQEVIGVAVINVTANEGLKLRTIKVRFEGEAKVHWTESEQEGMGDDRKTVTKHYDNYESYFDSRTVLFPTDGGGGDSRVLPGGYHQYPFRFRLPEEIPSSFEAPKGWVRYCVKVTIDRPWAFNSSSKMYFTVVSLVDLNRMPHVAEPATFYESKEFYTLFVKRGPMTANMTINKTGFAPGEAIRISAHVKNSSKVTINEVKAVLKQKISFHARGKTVSQEHTLGTITDKVNLEKDGVCEWTEKPLPIPAVPPSQLKYCTIISIDYWLEFKVVPSGAHLTLTQKAPLTIGTIPLRQSFSNVLAPPGAGAEMGMGFQAPPPPGCDPCMALPPPGGNPGMAYPPPPGGEPGAYPPPGDNPGMAYPPPGDPGMAAPPPPYPSAPLGVQQAPMGGAMAMYPDLPPPSYTDATGIVGMDLGKGGSKEDEVANWEFVPKYPTWQMPQ